MTTLKTWTTVGLVVLGGWLGQSAWATVYTYSPSSKDCRLDNSGDNMVCKFSHAISLPNGGDKMWLRTDVAFTPSEDGRLKFSLGDGVVGELSINDGMVTDLQATPSAWNVDEVSQRQPLKITLTYHINGVSGKYQMPTVSLLEFGFGATSLTDHQLVIGGFEVAKPAVCSFEKETMMVNLKPIKVNDIYDRSDRRQAGDFSLKVQCRSSIADIQMAFKDANSPNNTSNTLTTKQGTGYAKGVGLQFEHKSGGLIAFSPTPASIDSTPPHQWRVDGSDGQYQSDFLVYYINTDGTVSAGKVQGDIIATIAFK